MPFIRNEKIIFPQFWTIILLVLGTLLISFLTVFSQPLTAQMILGTIVALTVFVLVIYQYTWGIYMLFLFSIFMFYIQRIATIDFPLGVVYDFLIILIFFSMLINKRDKPDWSYFLNPITWAIIALIFLHLVQVLNPEGTFPAWVVSLRKNAFFILYAICLQAILIPKGLRNLSFLLIGLASIVALYGIYQEVFGLSDAEWRWLNADEERLGIFMIWGNMREFSFLSDPSSFGNFMAASGLACIIFAIRLPGAGVKTLLGMLALIILLAMTFSGTRTSYAIVAVGLAFYFLITMRSEKTMIIGSIITFACVVLLFGPFHSWQVNRIRSAFVPSEDNSMSVRDEKRIHYQPYIQSHPIGGGVFTTAIFGKTYAPDHQFAGIDPDSGYLETAMESGWIGLILLLGFIFITVWMGIDNYFSMEDPVLKSVLLAYLVPFFALSIGHFAQNAMFAKPVDLFVVIALSVIAHARKLDKTNRPL